MNYGSIKTLISRIILPKAALPFYSRYTYHYNYWAMISWSVWGGIVTLGAYVLKKGLHASDGEIAAYFMALGISYLLTPFWSQFQRRHGTQEALFITSLIEALPLFLVAFVWRPWQFILLMAVNMLAETAFFPARNFITQQNYTPSLRGRIFGQLQSYFMLISFCVALVAGLIMDMAHFTVSIPWFEGLSRAIPIDGFRLLFPVAAAACLIGYVFFRSIRPRGEGHALRGQAAAREESYLHNLITSYRAVFNVLRTHRDFLIYEMGFVLYGMAYLMLQPVTTIFADQGIQLSYLMYALAAVSIPALVQLLLSPVWGALLDKLKGPRTSLLVYAVMTVCAGVLFFATFYKSEGIFMLGFVLLGAGLSGVVITWNLGSVEFAGKGEADRYLSAHFVLVGLYTLIAPALGVGLLALLGGPHWVCLFCAGFFMAAATTMFFLGRTMRRREVQRQSAAL